MLVVTVVATVYVDGQTLGRVHLVLQEDHFSFDLPQGTSVSVKYSQILRYGLDHHRGNELERLYVQYTHSKDGDPVETCIIFHFDAECVLLRMLEMLIELLDVDVQHLSEEISHRTIKENSTCQLRCQEVSCTYKAQTVLLKTHVTCIRFYGELLLAGVGDTLLIFQKGNSNHCWTLLVSRQIFQGQHIHGICVSTGDYFIVYGGRSVSFLRLCSVSVLKVRVVYSFKVPDWVLDCSWLDCKQIALLTANNALLLYNLLIHKPLLISVHRCAERCIIYSGTILGNTWNDLVVLAGTVFSTIVIWLNTGKDHTKHVIHRLESHKGVIFSVSYCRKNQRICSTSDDRSVRVWDVKFEPPSDWTKCAISLRYSVYGHSARVWKSSLLENGQIVSIGEDARICLWNTDGTLDTYFSGHQDGEIWSLDVSEALQLIATGGSDGGIILWPMKKTEVPRKIDFSHQTDLKPKCVGLSKEGKPFMVSWNGDVFLFSSSGWNLCLSEPELKSYCIHAMTPDRQMLAFASITGRIIICRFSGSDSLLKIVDTNVCKGRIFSLVWLSNSSIVICESDGLLSIWKLLLDCHTLKKEVDLVLPHSKERWITSCATNGNHVVCGDRGGSLFLYRNDGKTKDPVHVWKKIHGHNGVTDVQFFHGNFVSTGRDGKYREYVVDGDKLIMLRCCKLKLEWAAAVCETNLLGRVLFCFHELFFVIWSIKERQPVVKIDCGGGHRSWDCTISNTQKIIFITFIKGKSVHYCSIPVDDVLCHLLLPGTHPKAINSADFVYLPGKEADGRKLIILGGEDTTVRLISIYKDGQIELRILQSHLSSVRTVASYQSKFNNAVYIASGGGRGQVVLWKVHSSQEQDVDIVELTSHSVLSGKNNVSNDSAEMRIMDLQVYQSSKESVMIAACCSDGMLRLFDYSIDSNFVREVQAVDCKQCLLSVRVIYSTWGCTLIVASTGGSLLGYSIENSGLLANNDPDLNFLVSQTGINCCDYCEKNGDVILSCAGDDAVVNIIMLRPASVNNSLQITDKWSHNAAHTCQVSGLKMMDNLVFSAGLDQKLAIFAWSISGDRIKSEMIAQVELSIPDIHGVLVWKCPEKRAYKIYVHGLGTQLVEFSNGQFFDSP